MIWMRIGIVVLVVLYLAWMYVREHKRVKDMTSTCQKYIDSTDNFRSLYKQAIQDSAQWHSMYDLARAEQDKIRSNIRVYSQQVRISKSELLLFKASEEEQEKMKKYLLDNTRRDVAFGLMEHVKLKMISEAHDPWETYEARILIYHTPEVHPNESKRETT